MTDFTKQQRNVLRVEGGGIVILGLLAILLPRLATFGIGLLLGGILLVSGVFKLLRAWHFRRLPGFGLSLTVAVMVTAAGLALLVYPWEGLAMLTLMLVVLFVFEGIGEITYAIQSRDIPIWGWIMASGVASLIIASLLLINWPGSTAWAIGLLVGINLLFTGAWLLAMSSAIHRVITSGGSGHQNL